jgi:hypothetical protein
MPDEVCPYCNRPIDDALPTNVKDDWSNLLWRHPGMECPVLGKLTFTFPGRNADG